MFPRGLIIATVIGVTAGLVFGVIFLEFKNSNQLIFIEGSSMSIITEKLDFKKGEEIKIRIVNSGTVPLTFSDASYGLQITGLSGMLMYTPVSTQVISELKPGQEIKFVWDQIKNDGNTTLEGVYKISSKATNADGESVKKSTSITIWK